jgi:ATP-binding cassette, subfamily B, multidrug efflux pump
MMLLRLVGQHARPYRKWLIGVLVLQAAQSLASLLLPALNADVLNHGVLVGDTSVIWSLGGLMIALTVLELIAAVAAVYCSARVALGVGRDLRRMLFERVVGISAQDVTMIGPSSLITRVTNDVQQVQLFVTGVCANLVIAPLTVVAGIALAIHQDPSMSWLVALALPLIAVPLGLIIHRMIPATTMMQQRIDRVNAILREQVIGLRVVRAFTREPEETERFARVNDDLSQTMLTAGRLSALMMPTMLLVVNVCTIAVVWVGSGQVQDGNLSIGAMVAFISYLGIILGAVIMATFVVMMAPRASVCAGRIQELLDTTSTVTAPLIPIQPPASTGVLELRDVGFRYPGAELSVLSGVSFATGRGETTAIIGSTGAGKTSLLNLIPRLFDATSGTILLDDVDLRDLDPEVLRHRIGMVPQRPYLFSGTVATNLRTGKSDATDEEIWEALEVAQAADFVRAIGRGLDAPISQGGSNLSGGQRQRLSIARALVRKPDIYLFDDCFSALDLATEARLRAALAPFTTDAAVLVVAQRVSTFAGADQIVVVDAGEVVGLGRHDDLMHDCPTYGEIVASQPRDQAAA